MKSEKRTRLKDCQDCTCIVNGVWSWILEVAQEAAKQEPSLEELLRDTCLNQNCLADAVTARLTQLLAHKDVCCDNICTLIQDALRDDVVIIPQIAHDLIAIVDRDAACRNPLEALLFFKGFHAITTYRVAHWLWNKGRHLAALHFQSLSSQIFSVDIHPAAQIGCGILLDHATSFVVGETAIISDNVSILHEVTLGGTGKEEGERHPIVESGVLLGAGAKILGRVTIGECAKVGAGSVVLMDVPPHTTVAGVPAVIISEKTEPNPALNMNQQLSQ